MVTQVATAAAPHPVAADGVDHQRDGCGVDAVGFEVGALGHRTGNDSGGRCAEDGLEHDVHPQRDVEAQMGIIALNEGVEPADESAGAAEHQAEADEPVAGRADAKIHHIFHEDIAGVLSAGEACLAEREAGLHEVDEERSHERPTGVDGAEHNADTSPHILPPGASPAAHTHPAAASLYLRSSAENPEKEALCLSLGRRGQASPGNTKGADRIFIRQRLCFRWQKYRAVWSKCQEQNAIFDILHKPKKKGQRKLWQTSFFLGVARPHLDMEQQAHQRP